MEREERQTTSLPVIMPGMAGARNGYEAGIQFYRDWGAQVHDLTIKI